MPVLVQQHILRLQVPVDDIALVKLLQRYEHLCQVEDRVLQGQAQVLFYQLQELASR